MWVGFPFSFLGVGKKQNKFIQFASTYQRAKFHLSIIYFLSISHLSIEMYHFLTLVANVGGMKRAGLRSYVYIAHDKT
jgi:hypothetical protein